MLTVRSSSGRQIILAHVSRCFNNILDKGEVFFQLRIAERRLRDRNMET